MKISVFFCCDKMGTQKAFEDKLIVCGDSFREEVRLRAYTPREILDIPESYNVGRLMIGQ